MEFTSSLVTLAKCASIGFVCLTILTIITIVRRKNLDKQRQRDLEWDRLVGSVEQLQESENEIQLGHDKLWEALRNLIDVIESSRQLSPETKLEHIEIAYKIGKEVLKTKPNKVLLKVIGDGLLIDLKAYPDLAESMTGVISYLPK